MHQLGLLFDHLVGASQQCGWHREAERLSRSILVIASQRAMAAFGMLILVVVMDVSRLCVAISDAAGACKLAPAARKSNRVIQTAFSRRSASWQNYKIVM